MGENLHSLTVDALRKLVRHVVDDTARQMIGEKISTVFDTDEGRHLRLQVVQSMRKFLPDQGNGDSSHPRD